MFSTNVTVIWFLFFTWVIIMIQTSAFPQSFEHNYVRIHIPVYKHTRHHTRTLVKKIPIPIPVPVPVLKERPAYKWYESLMSSVSHQEDDRQSEIHKLAKNYEKEYEDDFESF